jgi:hypothetical protein
MRASNGQKAETSKNRNLGKIDLNPAFVVLKLTAQIFLQAQGITSVLTFTATNANELAPAWIEWNEGAFNTPKSTAGLECWKRDVQNQSSYGSAKMGAIP